MRKRVLAVALSCAMALSCAPASGLVVHASELTDVQAETAVEASDAEAVLVGASRFTDVPEDAWYATSVMWAAEKGIITGTSTTTFSPNDATTRGMLVTILYRMAGSPAVAKTSQFSDVSENAYYANAVAWAYKNDLATGTSTTTFSPNQPITREQMAKILYNYAELNGIDTTETADLTGYKDYSKISNWGKKYLSWTVAENFLSGSNNKLDPKGNTTRAQVASILRRFSSSQPTLTKINITADTTEIYEEGGSQAQLTVTSATDGVAIASVTYSSSNEQVATVSSTGVVTGVHEGSATITVTAKDSAGNAITDAITITVKKKQDITLSLDKETVSISLDEKVTLTALVSGESTTDILKWESLNPAVATVEAGENNTAIITGVSVGEVKIKASVGSATKFCTVTVKDDAVALSTAKATHYNTVTATFDNAVTEEEQANLVFTMVDKDGQAITINEKTWSEDGKSVDLVNNASGGFIAGEYTLTISGTDVSVNPSKAEMTLTIAERTRTTVEFVDTNKEDEVIYLPVAKNWDGDEITNGKKVTLNFKVLDQYGDQIEGIDPEEYVFTFTCDVFSLEDSILDKSEEDSIAFVVPSKASEGTKIHVAVYAAKDSKTRLGEANIELAYLNVNRIEINGLSDQNESKEFYQDDEKQTVYLDCDIYDNKGQEVDLADGNYNTITVKVGTNYESEIYITTINADTKKITATIAAGAYTKDGEPAQLTMFNGSEYNNSVYELTVLKAPVPTEVVLDAANTTVISNDTLEVKKIPITLINQYGKEMPNKDVTMDTLKEYFTITASKKNANWDESALSIVEENGEMFLVVSGAPIQKEKVGEAALVKLEFTPVDAEYSDNKTTLSINVNDPRVASKFVAVTEPKTSLYDNETTTFEFKITDQYDTDWTDDTGLVHVKAQDATKSISVDNIDYTNHTITLRADYDTTTTGDITFGVLGINDTTTYIKKTFTIKQNISNLKVTIDNKQAQYTAGDSITLVVQALDKNGQLMTSYNEEVTTPFMTYQDGVENTAQLSGIKFTDGVAKVTVKASAVTDAATFSMKLNLPGVGAVVYSTDADNTVKIVAGKLAKYSVAYADGTITIKAMDGEGNFLSNYNAEGVGAVIKAGDEIISPASGAVLEFKDGVATYTTSANVGDKVITVTSGEISGTTDSIK